MRTTRLASVVTIVLGVLLLPTPAHTAPAPTATPAATQAAAPALVDAADRRHDRRSLADDVVVPRGRSPFARIRKWPGHTIPYYESIPAKWDWSLDQAIDHWNQAGGKIKFVEVPRSKAKLVISYGDTYGADGIGTLGYSPYGDIVHLSPAYKKVDEHIPEERVWVGRLFTHELGHVLGFNHTPGACSLMVAIYDFGVCPPLPDGKPGYYNCRWIDKKLLKRFVQMYGGKAKRPPALCLIEELPGELKNVTFSGGNTEGKPVRITWTPPAKVRDGTKVRITVSEVACAALQDESYDVLVDPKAGSWTDPTFAKGTWCYRTQIRNRYGAGRPPQSAALPRYAPVPAAPDVGTPTFHSAHGGWHVAWSPPLPNTWLEAIRNPDAPGTCITTWDQYDGEFLDAHGAGTRLLAARAPVECVTFFVVTGWGTVSPGTSRTLTVPAAGTPAAPAVGPRTWDPSGSRFTFSWTAPDQYTTLRAMRAPYEDPTTCPVGYSDDDADYVDYDPDIVKWAVYANRASECLVLYAVTDWGTRSQTGTQIVTQVPAPTVTPTVGTVGPYAGDPSAASATATLSTPDYYLGIEVLEGVCPVAVPADLGWFDGYEDFDHPNLWYFYPEPFGSSSQQCVMFTARDGFDQHGPVVKRQFTVAP